MIELLALGGALYLMDKAKAGENQAPNPIGADKKPTKYNRFDAIFQKYASQYAVDWRLLKTIAMNESSLGTYKTVQRGLNVPTDVEGSKSQDGLSWGIMQFTLKTARMYEGVSEKDLNNPETSIRLAAKHFAYLKKIFAGVTRDMVMAYNHGEGNQQKFVRYEQLGVLKPTEWPAGREYWRRYQENFKRLDETGEFKV